MKYHKQEISIAETSIDEEKEIKSMLTPEL